MIRVSPCSYGILDLSVSAAAYPRSHRLHHGNSSGVETETAVRWSSDALEETNSCVTSIYFSYLTKKKRLFSPHRGNALQVEPFITSRQTRRTGFTLIFHHVVVTRWKWKTKFCLVMFVRPLDLIFLMGNFPWKLWAEIARGWKCIPLPLFGDGSNNFHFVTQVFLQGPFYSAPPSPPVTFFT